MAPESTPAKSGKLSLYADLLDPPDNSSQAGTISRAPVVFKQASGSEPQQDDNAAAKKQQISAASLRFQPTKRPQLSNQKAKPKPTIPKPTPPRAGLTASGPTESNAPPATESTSSPVPANTGARPAVKSTLADWTTNDDDDVNGFYGGEKRQRGGRKKRKKNREVEIQAQNWDAIYDPSRPNNYEDYKHSEEKVREVREWKDRLYAHRMAQRRSSDIMSDDEDSRHPLNNQFAPPPMNFAPPPDLNDLPPGPSAPEPPIPEPPATVPDDPTGEDAYARRLRLSQNQGGTPADAIPPPPPPNPPMAAQPPSATISRPPVRYELPPPPEELSMAEAELEAASVNDGEPSEDAAAPRSNRPGQQGFAERLLSKYGWTKGSGLGANESGIAKPLQVKIEKQKKRPDSEGGGFVVPGGRGKIIGGKRKGDEDEGKFGAMSEVIVLYGMVDGMDLDAELRGSEDGGLMQEIGEECAEKYGRVERVYIDRNGTGSVPIFVKFTSQLSGLRAVNALEGRIFNGNTITARFFNNDKFEKGIYQE